MNDEDALHAVAAEYRRQQQARDPEWEEVARGQRSPQEAIEAARARGSTDEARLERAAELFAPLDDRFDDQLADRLLDQLGAAPEDDDPELDAPQASNAEVIEPPVSFWRRGGLGIGVAAAAAAVLVLVIRQPSTPGEPTPSSEVALPDYEVAVLPGAAAMRAADPEQAPRLQLGGQFEVLLRPAVRHQAPAIATVCLEQGERRVELTHEQAPGAPGETLSVRARIPPDLTPGQWTLVTIISAQSAGPGSCETADRPSQRVRRTAIELTTASP